MSLSPGTRLGRYEVIAPLGAGGMGEVFRARDSKLGRDVALKVLPDSFASDRRMLARFESEARAVAELLEGETLRTLLLRGPVPVRRALEIAREVAEGLAAAHAKGIVHRNVKPENVFLTKDGHAKLLDFGLARHGAAFHGSDDTHSPTLSALTDAGAVVGTVAYMSPEQARGLPVDHRSDQFSLGAVIYEMLAGKRAFHAEAPADVRTSIIRDEPEPLEVLAPSSPVPVRWIVDRCLAKEPDGRYESTRDLARDLARCDQHLTQAPPATAGLRPDGASRLTRWIAAVALAGIVGFGGVVAGFIAAPRSSERPLPSFRRLTFRRGFVSGALRARREDRGLQRRLGRPPAAGLDGPRRHAGDPWHGPPSRPAPRRLPLGRSRDLSREPDVARDGRALLAREDFRQRIFFRSGEAGPDRELSLFDCSRLWDMTRDGRTLSFWEYGEGAGRGERRVFLRSTSGGPPVHLEGGRGRRPVFSPDGAFFVTGIPGSEAVEVAIYPTGEGEPRKVPVSGFSDAAAGLLPDGAGIWLADMSPGRPQRVFVAGSDGTNRHPVTPEGVVGRVP